jgi:hypothetical protein
MYCAECGGRLALYVVGLCPRCSFDLTGEDEERDDRDDRHRNHTDSSPERSEP